MYTENGLLFPYYHTYPQEIHQFEQDFPCIFRPTVPLESNDIVVEPEGDLFKAPETITEDEVPLIGLDPTAAAAETSMISFGGEMIASQDFVQEQDIESSIDFGQLLSEVFYECKKDILAKLETEEPARSRVLEVEAGFVLTTKKDENNAFSQEHIRKSASTGCITSMDKLPRSSEPRDLLDYHGMDLEAVNGMRRAFSEGDLEVNFLQVLFAFLSPVLLLFTSLFLGNGSTTNTGSIKNTLSSQQQMIMNSSSSEDRMEKLLRYRNKKAKRNFGRKIKYACRKALADNQPRVRGRFVKTGGN